MNDYKLIEKYLEGRNWAITLHRESSDAPGETDLNVDFAKVGKFFRVTYSDGRYYDRSQFLANSEAVNLSDLVKAVSPKLTSSEITCFKMERLLGATVHYGFLNEVRNILVDERI